MKRRGSLRRGAAHLAAVLLLGLALGLAAGSANALTIAYDIAPGQAGIFVNDLGSVFVVTSNLTGSALVQTDGPIASGTTAEVLDLALTGSGRLCASCEAIGIEIALDTSVANELMVVEDPLEPGTFATDGTLSMIWTLSGSFGSIDLAVVVSTLGFGGRNDFEETFFASTYQVESVMIVGGTADDLDLSVLDRFKLRGPGVSVPEPTAAGLLGAGALLASGLRSRRRPRG